MIDPAVFTPEAGEDVAEAYRWYEEREPGFGEEFLRSMEACVENLRRHPALYPVVSGEFRRALLRRFPYEVFYEVTADRVTVYAVFHGAQDPRKWREGLRGG